MKTLAFGAFTLALLTGSAAAAQDQNFGPAIPGVCVYHHDRLLAQSTAGQAVQAGMQRLQQEVQAELAPYEQFIQSEGQQLQQGRGTIPQADFATREQALATRYQEARNLAQTREGELRYTQAMQLQQIAQATDPIVLALYNERGCGLLLSRDGVMRVNPTMDLTEAAIQRVNAALPTLSFSRMPVPAQQPAQ
ncbi:MAG: OmpH family outer membrane protein [Alphaproteobacteria bacterium]|nr:OmpH family outer membrane protein [Alphaproteobacteria bacterium]MBU2271050.1 OmpH family outer membrane protein [Alphaproteobacteria bacterium]MBU2419697.1 OmpH family outer membrane protein [Alphaproteobacteria bacterium]